MATSWAPLSSCPIMTHYSTNIYKKSETKKTGTRLTHYLSSDIQNEFIELCGKGVLSSILKEREESVYYSVICDATPDISHTEQNVLLLRYVGFDQENNKWEVVERFLEFKDFHKKTGSEIADMIVNVLNSHGIDLNDCRGQGYDNGANMYGKIKGVQAQLLKKNKLATFSPCASHTLNLVGVHAAQSSPEVTNFFGFVNRLYALVSASPERWAIYKAKTGCTLHRLSDTRWSARVKAVQSIAKHLPSVLETLDAILSTCSLTPEARSEASGLKKYFETFDTVFLLTVWVKVLQAIGKRNIILQSGKLTLETEAEISEYCKRRCNI
uniref:Zinc finger MYM-type protein 1-like isoform X1 n=1 Tax=Petromyzon marinus TaxID=7757 RepID=A0AAJ7UD64_PETMA|nr:zinc finger MYM-type protein 1-like isoform X1 [Petromyzon marinus]XP_032834284.1 zinc finger MYM-type protein 1-like isoform X1 [Petromyzon marinus]XP_032834285.1 zinc finger MYM-type protein 1-like isoform X1 [Petromyzon marinus]